MSTLTREELAGRCASTSFDEVALYYEEKKVVYTHSFRDAQGAVLEGFRTEVHFSALQPRPLTPPEQRALLSLGLCHSTYVFLAAAKRTPLLQIRAGYFSSDELAYFQPALAGALAEYFYLADLDLASFRLECCCSSPSSETPNYPLPSPSQSPWPPVSPLRPPAPAPAPAAPQATAEATQVETDAALRHPPDAGGSFPEDSTLLIELLSRMGAQVGWMYYGEWVGSWEVYTKFGRLAATSPAAGAVVLAEQHLPCLERLQELNQVPELPFQDYSAYVSFYTFSSAFLALQHDYEYICVGNEYSANAINTTHPNPGAWFCPPSVRLRSKLTPKRNACTNICPHAHGAPCHQLKQINLFCICNVQSFEAERAFHKFLRSHIHPRLYYFSGLQHMTELEIAKRFAALCATKYLHLIISCNWATDDHCTQPQLPHLLWSPLLFRCGGCEKCAFVFLLFAAFLPVPDIMSKIFEVEVVSEPGAAEPGTCSDGNGDGDDGHGDRECGSSSRGCDATSSPIVPGSRTESLRGVYDMYDSERHVPVFESLMGLAGHKPFECVGTPEECLAAMYLAYERLSSGGGGVAYDCSAAAESVLGPERQETAGPGTEQQQPQQAQRVGARRLPLLLRKHRDLICSRGKEEWERIRAVIQEVEEMGRPGFCCNPKRDVKLKKCRKYYAENTVVTTGLMTVRSCKELWLRKSIPVMALLFSVPSNFAEPDIRERRVLSTGEQEPGESSAWQASCVAQEDKHTAEVTSMSVYLNGARIMTTSKDFTVKIWDTSNMTVVRTFEDHECEVYGSAVTEDGMRAITSGELEPERSSVIIWSPESGKVLHSPTDHSGWLDVCAISGPAGLAAVTGVHGILFVWDIESGVQRYSTKFNVGSRSCCRFSPCGLFILVGGYDLGELVLVESRYGQELLRVHCSQEPGTFNTAMGCFFLSDTPGYSSATAAAGGGGGGGGSPTKHSPSKCTFGFPTRFGAVFADGSIRVFNMNGDSFDDALWRDERMQDVYDADVSRDGTLLFVIYKAGRFQEELHLYDFVTGELVWNHCTAHKGTYGLYLVASGDAGLVPDGGGVGESRPMRGKMVTAGGDRKVRLFDLAKRQLIRMIDTAHSQDIVCPQVNERFDQMLTTADGWDKWTCLWDLNTGKMLRKYDEIHNEGIYDAWFTPDGLRCVSVSCDKTAAIFELQSGEVIQRFVGHEHWVRFAALSPDEKILATASNDNTVRIWNVAKGNVLHIIRDHRGTMSYINFVHPTWIVTSARDGTIVGFNLKSGTSVPLLVAGPIGKQDGAEKIRPMPLRTGVAGPRFPPVLAVSLNARVAVLNLSVRQPLPRQLLEEMKSGLWDLQHVIKLADTFPGLAVVPMPDGNTLLHTAAVGGQVEFLRVLLSHGAAITSAPLPANGEGKTPLDLALDVRNLQCVELLLANEVSRPPPLRLAAMKAWSRLAADMPSVLVKFLNAVGIEEPTDAVGSSAVMVPVREGTHLITCGSQAYAVNEKLWEEVLLRHGGGGVSDEELEEVEEGTTAGGEMEAVEQDHAGNADQEKGGSPATVIFAHAAAAADGAAAVRSSGGGGGGGSSSGGAGGGVKKRTHRRGALSLTWRWAKHLIRRPWPPPGLYGDTRTCSPLGALVLNNVSDAFTTDIGFAMLTYKWDTYAGGIYRQQALVYGIFMVLYITATTLGVQWSEAVSREEMYGHGTTRTRVAVRILLEGCVLLLNARYLWEEIVQISRHGPVQYFTGHNSAWNWVELLSCLMVKLVVVLQVGSRAPPAVSPCVVLLILQISPHSPPVATFTYQVIGLEEARWVMSACTILLGTRLLKVASGSEGTGIFVQIIIRIIADLRHYLLIVLVTLLTYALAFRHIMAYYDQLHASRSQPVHDPPVVFLSLLFHSFPLTSSSFVNYQIDNDAGISSEFTRSFDGFPKSLLSVYYFMTVGGFTTDVDGEPKYVWYLHAMLISFSFMVSIILLNLLIAVMSDTYVVVKQHAKSEWMLLKARLVLEIDSNMPDSFFTDRRRSAPRWLHVVNTKRTSSPAHASLLDTIRGTVALNTDLNDTRHEIKAQISCLTEQVEALQRDIGRLVDALGGGAGGATGAATDRIEQPPRTGTTTASTNQQQQQQQQQHQQQQQAVIAAAAPAAAERASLSPVRLVFLFFVTSLELGHPPLGPQQALQAPTDVRMRVGW
ncbi:hypothetical protein VOLCADRAFT_98340 [Volvox carteri f. nagariensis]|uniref:Ion transport domain-containing protein n=1 Tax=Volvox carteri f. nagariensis TaxID=3068 RepID=D8UF35_VOLCA|nr:uncharacterized protein VOLCADRAFT_98340 [Volvox carteri f. nagariensis]EFJ41649.1 hypothetical protein VOLCADRAFT_98340 [Volvox carteri f. nagariensis]|eukprot:XP_002957305.1 hypothetical protein VOLCADRAFT_98340 [Volvox carteri f. nagariensis]